MAIARDKMWMFGTCAHDDDIFLFNTSETTKTLRRSRMTPAEGAFVLDIPNMILINSDGVPAPFSIDAYGYMESFTRMEKVMWSSIGSGGFRCGEEESFICEIAERYPNVVGTYLDDFYAHFADKDKDHAIENAIEFLAGIRKKLDAAPRRMDIYVTWYMEHLDLLNEELMKYIDGLTLWTSSSEELSLLEARFEKTKKAFPDKKILIGLYLYDYGARKSVPVDMMKHQCEVSLRLLKEGKIDGMIFLSNTVMGVGLESELWLREWLEEAKYTEIPD